jgi:hypothetical protein
VVIFFAIITHFYCHYYSNCNGGISFDLQLSNFGLDVDELKKPSASRIYRAWLEDWEIELPQVNDCVAEALILEKYKDLVFYDPDTKKTFKVWGGNLEFHRGSHKSGISKGWGSVCINEDCNGEGWILNEEVVQLIGSHPQADGIEVNHQEVEGGDE